MPTRSLKIFRTFTLALSAWCASISACQAMEFSVLTEKQTNGVFEAAPAEPTDAESRLALLKAEFALYPADVQAVLKQKVVLTGALWHAEQKHGLNGVVFPAANGEGTIWLDLTRGEVANLGTFHHEIFHSLEAVSSGNGIVSEASPVDEASNLPFVLKTPFGQAGWANELQQSWGGTNFPIFQYFENGHGHSMSAKGINDYCLPGFVSRYATIMPREDRAEVFKAMVMYYPQVVDRLEWDKNLRAKVDLIRKFLGLSFSDNWFTLMGERHHRTELDTVSDCDLGVLVTELNSYSQWYVDHQKQLLNK